MELLDDYILQTEGKSLILKENEAAIKKAEAEATKKAMEEKDRKFVTKLLKENWAIDKIQEFTEVPMDKILEIQAAIH